MMRNPLARVRGLGAARHGTEHWWAQRVTAVALVPLTIWLVVSVIANIGAGHDEMRAWLGHPVSAALMIALIVAAFHHMQLGLQVVIEDYVHNEAVKFAALLAIKGATWFVGLVGVIAVLMIAIGG